MGIGDDLMATGMARGARDRGKRIAFGDGKQIRWGPWSREIFRGNPNIAAPGSERSSDIEWCHYYKGNRIYNRQQGNRWVWNYEFKPTPGEIFFDDTERRFSNWLISGFVAIEPNVPQQKSVAVNKQWPVERFQYVADQLMMTGFRVVQFEYAGAKHYLQRVDRLATRTFRDALAALSRAALYLGHEGGLHHGAAAVGIPAVVLFGGFIPPQVTGYDSHTNLTGGATEFCGSLRPCQHCKDAMNNIGAGEVLAHVLRHL